MTQEPLMLGNRYQLKEIIGRGGMAEVWSAQDTRLDREVAIKRLRVDLATDPIFQARFQREAHSAAGLNHPNIVSVYDTGRQTDEKSGVEVPYIVMELVHGHTLRDVLRDGRQIVPQKALEFTMGVLDALSFSHRQGIVHRDIKPANIMLTPTGQVKVMDFGIARAVSDTSATMTQTAAVIGTAQYLSPEQARGETVDVRSDIYSAGCLLYELLTGRPPFLGDSPVSVAYQHVRENPLPPSQVDPEVTGEMDAVTLTALAKKPSDRYQTAKEMRDDIARLLNGEAVTAALPSVAPTTPARMLVEEPDATAVLPAAPPPVATPLTPSSSQTPDEQPKSVKKKLSTTTWILIGLLVLLLSTIGIFSWRWLNPPPPDIVLVEVRRVIGYEEEAAKSDLVNAKFSVAVENTDGPLETKNKVIAQDPKPGDKVPLGSKVTIWINKGPRQGIIPDGIVGKPEAEAKKLLRDAGFTTQPTIKEAPTGTEPITAKAGDVTSVSPPSGRQANLTDEIVLYLATGKSPMPDLTNVPKHTAIDIAKRSGFTNVGVEEIPRSDSSSTPSPGFVFKQSPEKGVLYNRVDRVIIYVAASPTPSASPSSSKPSPTSSKSS